MFRFNQKIKRGCMRHYAFVMVAAVSIAVVTLMLPVSAQEAKQKVFGSPEEAMKALVEAARTGDMKGVMAILGPEGEDILSSGDEVADKADRERFLKRYQEEVDLVKDQDKVSVIIGNDHFPFAIPIVKKGNGWVFDTKAGREEVLNRRVGRNELNASEKFSPHRVRKDYNI